MSVHERQKWLRGGRCHSTWTPRDPEPGGSAEAQVVDLRGDAVAEPRLAEAELGEDGLGKDPIVKGGETF